MTAPGPPTIIQRQGPGQAFQESLAPFLAALERRRVQQIQQQQFAQQQQLNQAQLAEQTRRAQVSSAIEVLFQGIESGGPGFANQPLTQQLEQTIGVPGFAKSIADARNKSAAERTKALREALEPLDEQTRTAVMASMTLGDDVPAAVRTDVFTRIAPAAPLSELDRANVDQTLLENAAFIRKRRTEAQREAAQPEAASRLGSEFIEGIDFVGIFEALKRQKDADPRTLLVQTTMKFLADRGLIDELLGRPMLPAEAFNQAKAVMENVYPSLSEVQFTPEFQAQFEALDLAARSVKDPRFADLDRDELEANLRTQLRNRFGPTIDSVLDDIITIAMRERER